MLFFYYRLCTIVLVCFLESGSVFTEYLLIQVRNMELTPAELGSYLAHLHISDAPAVTEDFLVALTRAHLEVVPFENLEVHYAHREPSLAASDLFRKVVERSRGGYCFELNKLFYLLLKGLGFTCYPVPARVVHRRQEQRPYSHRATVVEINGRKWFCDVGFGGAGPKGAIRMDTEEIQTVFGDDFSVAPDPDAYPGELAIYRFEAGAPEKVLVFRDMPWMEADFVTLNSYYATYPRSPFLTKRVLYRCLPGGWISLTENTVTRMTNGIRQTVELQTEDEVQALIEQEFDLFVRPL